MSALLDHLPRGNTLSDEAWQRRHRLLEVLLAAHLPALFLFGVLRGVGVAQVAEALALPLAALVAGHLMRSRRVAAALITLGLAYCSGTLVGFADGAIEAHFHFFITIGFIALYQDWVPFLLNVLFTVLSHGIGSSFVPDLMFNHQAAQDNPWQWSLIHGVSVLAACVGVILFWKTTEDEQGRALRLTQRLAEAELGQRQFTSDLLVNLARRNQNLLHRQLELLNRLEDDERDPDALADLFRLDHLATRIRRNAESLLVLSGEDSPRTWREPVALVDVVRAAIAEIEDLDRVDHALDESLSVVGRGVADLTHLFAELLENAVHFSPPGVTVMVRSRPLPDSPGTQLITVEDWGVGMTPAELAEANGLLRAPREVDLSVSQRLGLHVVARLAQRYGISVELTATPGGGVTAVVVLPPPVFARPQLVGAGAGAPVPALAGAGAPDAPVRTGFPAGRPAFPGTAFPPHGGAGGPAGLLAGPAAFVGDPTPGIPGAHRVTGDAPGSPTPVRGPGPGGLPRRDPGETLARTAPNGTGPTPFRPFSDSRRDSQDGWSSWWDRTAPAGPTTPAGAPPGPAASAERPPEPDPAPPRNGDSPAPAGPVRLPEPRPPLDDTPTGLRRRVPQANLAAGLRREGDQPAPAEEPAAPAVRDPLAARNALSRFQAAQRAAREAVEGEQNGGPSR